MGVITTGDIAKGLTPGVKNWWGRFYDGHPMQCLQLFDVESSNRNYEEDVEVTGFGLARHKSEGKGTVYDSEAQGVTSRYNNVAYSLGFIVTREEMDDNLYVKVSKTRTQALAWSFKETKENVAANVYNRAFDSSYVGGDGKELLATDHPSLSGDQSNELAVPAALSEVALEDLSIQIANAKNSKGLKISIKPKSLIVPPALTFEATRVLKSQLQSDTGNNDINALKALGTFSSGAVVNNYLSSATAYFIRTNAPQGMTMYDRVKREISQDKDFDTSNIKFKGYERYSVGWTDFRGLYGSAGL